MRLIIGGFGNAWKYLLCVGISCLLLGSFALLAPVNMAHLFLILLGAFISVNGVYACIHAYQKEKALSLSGTTLPGIIMLLLGACIMLAPEGASVFVIGLISFFMIFIGGIGLIISFLFRSKSKANMFGIISSILCLIAGIYLSGNTQLGVIFFMFVFGIFLIFVGLLLIAAALSAKKSAQVFKDMNEQFKKGDFSAFGNASDFSNFSKVSGFGDFSDLESIFGAAFNTKAGDNNKAHKNSSPSRSDALKRYDYLSTSDNPDVIEVENLAEQDKKKD